MKPKPPKLNHLLHLDQKKLIKNIYSCTARDTSFYEISKRSLDILLSLIILIILLPVWLIISLMIITTSRGPLFYKADVVGKNGTEFLMYKFRTMYKDSSTKPHEEHLKKIIAEDGKLEKLKSDPRITTFGAILRKFSIDEFPQLLNVIKGEMSLVGPRPCLPYEFRAMKEWQKKRVLVTPGMTGLWQIRGRDLSTFKEQVLLDLYYIIYRSFKLDMIILVKTIPVVILGKGGR